ncbi:MAG: class II aldolase/adducin family protein [Bacillus sp. (in: Bacteria)]|nr:class II aldolase/adducin family protein [Bacillus sp. (in: firmicutes)]
MITEIKFKKQICELGKKIYEKGFVTANNGSISIRSDDNEFLITPMGVNISNMSADMILKVDGQGDILEGDYIPSTEMKTHLLIYHERPEINAVVHAEPPYATAFAIAGIPIDQAIMPEAVVYLGSIPVAEYGNPSTMEVPNAVKKYVHQHQGVLLENHGALTWGSNLEHAYYLMEALESTAKINWISKQLNGDRELSQTHVQHLYKMKTRMGIKGKSPLGVETEEGIHVKKTTPPLARSLSESDLNLIVEKVTKNVLAEINKLFS